MARPRVPLQHRGSRAWPCATRWRCTQLSLDPLHHRPGEVRCSRAPALSTHGAVQAADAVVLGTASHPRRRRAGSSVDEFNALDSAVSEMYVRAYMIGEFWNLSSAVWPCWLARFLAGHQGVLLLAGISCLRHCCHHRVHSHAGCRAGVILHTWVMASPCSTCMHHPPRLHRPIPNFPGTCA
jgi:hypothetical protein